ncbi:MAG: hypothetical protein RL422_508 [Bacteroidota bacterium]|jgi:hypothetical protein
MHTKPLIDFVISEGRSISRLSNTALSDYKFIDNEKGQSLIFHEPFRAK